MQTIRVQEIETALNSFESTSGPIVVKRANKEDVVIISMEEYQERFMKQEIAKHLQKAEEDIENGRTIPADKYFEDLRLRYDY
jgi:PHD/YefM family antitoxin component YafN of YafNO toxin-antitoxin module